MQVSNFRHQASPCPLPLRYAPFSTWHNANAYSPGASTERIWRFLQYYLLRRPQDRPERTKLYVVMDWSKTLTLGNDWISYADPLGGVVNKTARSLRSLHFLFLQKHSS